MVVANEKLCDKYCEYKLSRLEKIIHAELLIGLSDLNCKSAIEISCKTRILEALYNHCIEKDETSPLSSQSTELVCIVLLIR